MRRLALATPYPDVIAAAGRAYWEAAGLEVVRHHRLEGVANIYEETTDRVLALGRAADAPDAEAVLISGTGLPTAEAVAPLERALGKPVVTSQSATLWWLLRTARVRKPVPGWGRLLATLPSPVRGDAEPGDYALGRANGPTLSASLTSDSAQDFRDTQVAVPALTSGRPPPGTSLAVSRGQ